MVNLERGYISFNDSFLVDLEQAIAFIVVIKQLDILANAPVTKAVLFALGVQLVNLQRVNATPAVG